MENKHKKIVDIDNRIKKLEKFKDLLKKKGFEYNNLSSIGINRCSSDSCRIIVKMETEFIISWSDEIEFDLMGSIIIKEIN